MKKVLLFLCCIFISGTLTACGQKAVDENQILNDIKTYEGFAPLNVEVDNWEITKRQTNFDDKTDFAYCTVHASNDDYSVVRNYKMKYVLYNDGWLLENVEYYENPDCPDETVPLHGVSHEQVEEDVSNMDFLRYASFLELLIDLKVQSDTLEKGNYLEIDDFGLCEYRVNVEYETYTYFEKILVPIEYYFTKQENGSYGWDCWIKQNEIERNLRLNSNVLGKYVLDTDSSPGGSGEVEILSCDGNNFSVSYSLFWQNIFDTINLSGTGQTALSWNTKEDGTLSLVNATLPNNSNYYLGFQEEFDSVKLYIKSSDLYGNGRVFIFQRQ